MDDKTILNILGINVLACLSSSGIHKSLFSFFFLLVDTTCMWQIVLSTKQSVCIRTDNVVFDTFLEDSQNGMDVSVTSYFLSNIMQGKTVIIYKAFGFESGQIVVIQSLKAVCPRFNWIL